MQRILRPCIVHVDGSNTIVDLGADPAQPAPVRIV